MKCSECGDSVFRKRIAPTGRAYCDINCKAAWQRRQKPVTKEWLVQKYLVEKLNCAEIARIVNRDTKSVWNWLKDFRIPTRPRGHDSKETQFKSGQTSAFKGRRHTIKTRKLLSKIAKADGRVPFDPAVGPPYKGKRGAEIPSWKGGVTPERQVFYSTAEWKAAVKAVWAKDNGTCQRCGIMKRYNRGVVFHIHHIVPFEVVELRSEVSNLVLVCKPCHYWIHSNKNTNGLLIRSVNA
jgi:5-methylcytosine-specific restriction endonuclease McrA